MTNAGKKTTIHSIPFQNNQAGKQPTIYFINMNEKAVKKKKKERKKEKRLLQQRRVNADRVLGYTDTSKRK